MLEESLRKKILGYQKVEITEHHFYRRLAESMKEEGNREILKRISRDELAHYDYWKKHTGEEVKPSELRLAEYLILSRIFGITFAIKLIEKNEAHAQEAYDAVSHHIPEVRKLVDEENAHEKELINLIDEKRLRYTGAVVRGLNDGIVEITGEVAGLSFVFHDSLLIGVIALITGSVGSLSLASSEYLAAGWEEGPQTPLGAAGYTVVAYMLSLLVLIWPFLIISEPFFALAIVIVNAIILIFFYNYHLSVAKEINFSRRFIQMLLISLGIAVISFLLGYLIQDIFHIET